MTDKVNKQNRVVKMKKWIITIRSSQKFEVEAETKEEALTTGMQITLVDNGNVVENPDYSIEEGEL